MALAFASCTGAAVTAAAARYDGAAGNTAAAGGGRIQQEISGAQGAGEGGVLAAQPHLACARRGQERRLLRRKLLHGVRFEGCILVWVLCVTAAHTSADCCFAKWLLRLSDMARELSKMQQDFCTNTDPLAFLTCNSIRNTRARRQVHACRLANRHNERRSLRLFAVQRCWRVLHAGVAAAQLRSNIASAKCDEQSDEGAGSGRLRT